MIPTTVSPASPLRLLVCTLLLPWASRGLSLGLRKLPVKGRVPDRMCATTSAYLSALELWGLLAGQRPVRAT